MVSLFILVIIVRRLVILDQIVFCKKHTDLGLSRMLRGKVKLKNLPHLNMPIRIGDIYKVRIVLFVRMLTLIMWRLSRSI
jgi:hypothetical protein